MPGESQPQAGPTAPGASPGRNVDPLAWFAALRGLLARPLASYYLLLASSGLLLVIGLAMVFSVTSVRSYATEGSAYTAILKQVLAAVVGLVAFWVCQRLPRRTFRAVAPLSMLVAILLLVLLDGISLMHASKVLPTPEIGPIRSDELWLWMGPLQLQPSEVAKFALVLWGADVLTRKGGRVVHWRELAMPLFPAAALLFVLVGYEDLGSLLCLVIIFVGLLWAAGVPLRFFGIMLGGALAGIALLIVAPGKGYRFERFDGFFRSDAEIIACKGDIECHQAKQGLLAISDGGWFGVGLGNGSFSWGWLPSAHNDFIFAVIAEELGVVGCLVVLILFAVLAYTGMRIARRVGDPFRRMAACAVTLWLVGQTVINIGGVVKLLPITGLPLPFISDGGTALVVTMAAVGMLASFARAEPAAARALHARPSAKWVQLVWAPLPPLPTPARPADAAATSPAAGTSRVEAGAAARGGPGERRR